MIKFICAVIVCGLIGFGSYSYYQENKAHHLEMGLTKFGESCRIVAKWGNGNHDMYERQQRVEEFLKRNPPLESEIVMSSEATIYDCFLDLDTQGYWLTEYKKTANLSSFEETFVFESIYKPKSSKSRFYQYTFYCQYKDLRKRLFCMAGQGCYEKTETKIKPK